MSEAQTKLQTKLKSVLRRYRGWAYLLGLRQVEFEGSERLVRDWRLHPDDWYDLLEEIEDRFGVGGRSSSQRVWKPDASINELLLVIEQGRWPADWLINNTEQT